jgi:hypothetical protein
MLPKDWAKVMKKRHVYVQVKSSTFLQKKKHAEHKQTILPRISDAILRVLVPKKCFTQVGSSLIC